MPSIEYRGTKKPDLFCQTCGQVGLPIPLKEAQFWPGRKWAVDYLFVTDHITIALEVDGWGHKTTARYDQDLDKYNSLTEAGIFLIRTKPKNLYTFEKTLNIIARAISNAAARSNNNNNALPHTSRSNP